MARPRSIPLRKKIRKVFSGAKISKLAKSSGAFKRTRKIKPVDFFWTLVLGFGTGRVRTISGLRRSYECQTGTKVVPSAFYDRFSRCLVNMLKMAVIEGLKHLTGIPPALQGPLGAFEDVVVTDSTVMRLNELLEKQYPACRTNHTKAALKMHAVISVRGKGSNSVKLTSQRKHDGPVFKIGNWVKNSLLLFDLGYFKYRLFAEIEKRGGYFLSRLKSNVDPVIVKENEQWKTGRTRLENKKLRDVVEIIKRDTIDVMVRIPYRKRRYGKRKSGRLCKGTFRVVGVRNPENRRWHLYITNLPPERISAKEIGQLYRARWLIELLFREIKSRYRMNDLPSGNKNVVESLVYAAILTFIVSRTLLEAVQWKLGPLSRRVPPERWAAIFSQMAQLLLLIVVRPPRQSKFLEGVITEALLHEAIDPNKSRRSLLESIEIKGLQNGNSGA